MRMPILSYLFVGGSVLFGALALVSNQLEFRPLPVTQMIGVPPPYKDPLENSQPIPSMEDFENATEVSQPAQW